MSNAHDVAKAQHEWEETTLKKALSRSPERREHFQTTSDIDIQRVYTREDIKDDDYQDKLSFPGQYPYTRGVQPTMYRGRFWTMR